MSCLIQGCLPIPHLERTASELKGVVLSSDGTPLPAVSVKRVLEIQADQHGRECMLPGETVATDLVGRFHFSGARKFLPVVPLIGEPTWKLYLCAGSGNQMSSCFGTIQFGHPPAKLSLACIVTGDASACRCTVAGSWD
jgi:hypothetical protein